MTEENQAFLRNLYESGFVTHKFTVNYPDLKRFANVATEHGFKPSELLRLVMWDFLKQHRVYQVLDSVAKARPQRCQ